MFFQDLERCYKSELFLFIIISKYFFVVPHILNMSSALPLSFLSQFFFHVASECSFVKHNIDSILLY